MHPPVRPCRAAALLLLPLLLALLGSTSTTSAAASAALDMDYQPVGTPHEPHRCGYADVERRLKELYGDNVTMTAAPVTYASAPHASLLTRVRRLFSVRGTAASDADVATWQPIRISFFTEDLNNSSYYCTAAGQVRSDYNGGSLTCTEAQVLTDAKKALLVNTIVPKAIKLHEERLLVQPSEHFEVLPLTYWPSFHPPASHLTEGVSGVDMVLYLAAAPISSGTVAWASAVQQDTLTKRPIVGVVNVSPEFIEDTTYTIRVITHEILHTLGFINRFFDAYTTSASGGSGYQYAPSIRGKTDLLPALYSPRVLSAAQEHYGCPTMKFVELEDQGGSGTAGSHWKMRNAKDELMSPVAGTGIYTAMTIAAMEDLGFYQGNYSMAEEMTWGKGAGCTLLDEKCIVGGASMEPSMFCTNSKATSSYLCPSDRLGLGYCAMTTFSRALPSYFQYFSDADEGGVYDYMDYCPAVSAYSNLHCDNGNTKLMPGSVISSAARCMESASSGGISVSGARSPQTAVCVDVKCNSTTVTYQIRVKGSSKFVDCPEGSSIVASQLRSSYFISGGLKCAPYGEVCFENSGDVGDAGDGAALTASQRAAHTILLCVLLVLSMCVLV